MPLGLERVVVRNWRALDEVAFDPDARVSWIMGPNGAGKSSLLDALAFPCDLLRSPHAPREALAASARGMPISHETWAFRDLLRDPMRPATWELHFTDVEEQRWRYHLALEAQGAAFVIVEERLERLHEARWTSVLEQDPNGGRLVRGGWPGGTWAPMVGKPTVPLLARATDPIEHAAVAGALAFLRGIWLVHPDPLLMRGRAVRYDPDAPLDRYGRDLEGLLDATVAAHPAEFASVIEQLTDSIGWRAVRAVTQGHERRVVFEDGPGRPLALDLASDGQLVAAWLAVLADFPPDGWFVALVDEPAVALARGPQAQVFTWLRDLALNVQVLAATHDEHAPNFDTRDSVWTLRRDGGGAPVLRRLDEDERASRFSPIFKPGEVAVSTFTASEE